MTHGVREDEDNREDAAKRTKEAQCSFERFTGTIPWRSVSDSEGMAAFGMLGLQQAGDGGSRSTSRDNATSVCPRVDSDSWSFLLASGGETVPGANIGGRGAGLVAGGETPDSRTRGSSFAGVSGEDMLASNDPGPMPERAPFGGYGSHGASSGSGSGRSRSSDSRTGPLRTSRDSNSLEVFSSLTFGNYPSVSWGSWGRLERNRSSSSGTGSVGDGDGGEGTAPFYGLGDVVAGVGRQYSFDPYRPIDPLGSMGKVPMIFDPPKEMDFRSKPPIVTYPTLGGTSWERHNTTYGESTRPSAATSGAGTVDERHPKEDRSRDWSKEDRLGSTKDPGAMPPHRRPALGSDRPSDPDGERKAQEPNWSFPAHPATANDLAGATPVDHHQGDCKEERRTVPSQAASTSGRSEEPSGFDLLASMIPDLSKIQNSKGGASLSSRTGSSGGGTLQAPPRRSDVEVGGTPVRMGQAPHGSKTEVLPPVTRSPSPPRTPPTSLPEGLETEIREYHGFLHDRPVLLTGRRAAIERFLYKKRRRPFVQQERDNDPERELQKKSRQRPRQRGKFCKKGQDFISITQVQAAGDGRSFSGEVPASEIEANKKGEASRLARASLAVRTAGRG